MKRSIGLVFSLFLLGLGTSCATVADEQHLRIATWRAAQSQDFLTRLATSKVDPKKADLVALVTADAINEPLKRLDQKAFVMGHWTFTPTRPPVVELSTGSALVRITGEAKNGATSAEVTLVGGLSVRWTEDGSHLYFQPFSLGVVPTLNVGVLDFALGAFLRSFAETKADDYLRERVGEIDLPVQLLMPFQRREVALEQVLSSDDGTGATLRYGLPEASAQVKLDQLYVWLLEGRVVVMAFADVVRTVPVMPAAPVIVTPGGAAK